jgi:hypothetical protein
VTDRTLSGDVSQGLLDLQGGEEDVDGRRGKGERSSRGKELQGGGLESEGSERIRGQERTKRAAERPRGGQRTEHSTLPHHNILPRADLVEVGEGCQRRQVILPRADYLAAMEDRDLISPGSTEGAET